MRLYIFKSETRRDLHAFAGDAAGSQLPKHHGPWTGTGIVTAERAPPFKLSRDVVEAAINKDGYQLWRLPNKSDA
jgi:hypothetical protein